MKKVHFVFLIAVIVIVLCGVGYYFFPGVRSRVNNAIATGPCKEFVMSVTEDEGKKIDEMISTIAHTSAMGLLFKKGHLEDLGNQLGETVPPFQFIAYIFANQKLADDMALIKKSSMKYTRFVAGMQPNLLKDYDNGCLYIHADGFASYLNIDKDTVVAKLDQGVEAARTKGDKKAFIPFVDYLISVKASAAPESGKAG